MSRFSPEEYRCRGAEMEADRNRLRRWLTDLDKSPEDRARATRCLSNMGQMLISVQALAGTEA